MREEVSSIELYKIGEKHVAHLHFEPHSFAPSFSGEWEQQVFTSERFSATSTSPNVAVPEQHSPEVNADPIFGKAINMAIMIANSLIYEIYNKYNAKVVLMLLWK